MGTLVRLLVSLFVLSHWAAQWETTLEPLAPGTQLYSMRRSLATLAKVLRGTLVRPLMNVVVPSHWAAQWDTTLELPVPGTHPAQ